MPLFWTASAQCDDDALRRQLDAAATSLGFDIYGLVTWRPLSATKPTAHLLTNADPRWQAVVLARDRSQIRTVVEWCKRHATPIVWAADALSDSHALDAAQARELRHRWSQGVRGSLGVDGTLTFSRALRVSDEEVQAKRLIFPMLATKAHQRWLARVRARAIAALPEPLSPRETEVLRWAVGGKIAEDIATLLRVQPTTVRFHAKNATKKLGAENTTSAAYRALVLGLLHRDWGTGD